jgi:tight adherence protein C
MMQEYILLGLIFVFFFGITLMGYLALVRRRQRVEARLEPTPSSDPTLSSNPELLLGDMTPALSAQIPMTEEGRSELQRDLRGAGMYRPTALMEYAAVRAVLTIVPLLVGGLIALMWTETVAGAVRVWIGAAVVAMLGFSVPRIYLLWRASQRRAAIERGLPMAIDMLTLCLSAGLNVVNSLQRVAQEVVLAYPDLAYELQIVRRQADLRSLEFALVQFAERVDLPQLRNISMMLTQSEKLGTDGITVLREYADNMRVSLRHAAEAASNRAPLKMMLPGYLMGIGLIVLIITPPAMEIAAFRQENLTGTIQQEAVESLKSIDESKDKGKGKGTQAP